MGVNGIYGLSGSGLDVESMVKVGMLAKQNEYDKMQQKYTKNEWKKSEFLDLYGEVQTFNNSTLSQYKMSSNMNARSATSANSSIVTATANASAAQITHYVEVDKLSSAAYLIGTKLDRQNDKSDVQNQLQSVLFTSMERDGDKITVKYNITDGDGQTVEKTGTFYATETAISFALNDGVNGMAATSNEKAVTAYAAPEAEASSHTVVINSLATAPEVMQGGNIPGLTSDAGITNFIARAFEIPAESVDAMIANYTTITDTAFAFTFSDGLSDTKISFSFADLANTNTTVASFLENLNSQFEAAGLNIHANYTASGNGGSLSISNSELGSKNKVQISIQEKDIAKDKISLQSMVKLASALFAAENDSTWRGTIDTETVTTASGDTTLKVSYTLSGKNATGTIDGYPIDDTVDIDGNPAQPRFDGNTYVDTDNKITYTALAVTSDSTTASNVTIKSAGALAVNITYADLLDGFTFSELTSKINALGTNVRASYDSVQDRFYFYNKESGAKNNITISIASDTTTTSAGISGDTSPTNYVGAQTADFFNALGLKQSSNGEIESTALEFKAGKSSTQSGTDALVRIDGVDYPLENNKATVNGVSYNFQNLTEKTGRVAVTVTQDTAAIVSKVKSFVDDYNALLKKLYEWYDEKPNSDYKPLTASQRDAMKDEQIEKWEEKAKAGLLYHDKTLGNLITELRSAVSGKVEGVSGKYNTIFALGISTTGTKGQLTLDESKLNTALAEDPDAVYNVFAKLDGGEKQYLVKNTTTGKTFWTTNTNQVDDDKIKYVLGSDGKPTTKNVERASYNGIAQRLGDVFMTGMKNIKSVSGSSAEVTEDSELNNLLRELQTKMSNFKRMMAAFETQLYKKYDAMESSLALLGAQLNYVTGAFSQ